MRADGQLARTWPPPPPNWASPPNWPPPAPSSKPPPYIWLGEWSRWAAVWCECDGAKAGGKGPTNKEQEDLHKASTSDKYRWIPTLDSGGPAVIKLTTATTQVGALKRPRRVPLPRQTRVAALAPRRVAGAQPSDRALISHTRESQHCRTGPRRVGHLFLLAGLAQ
eukprot:scaffold44129_cov61-Phaeocystis_antarctica.AAC.9